MHAPGRVRASAAKVVEMMIEAAIKGSMVGVSIAAAAGPGNVYSQ